MGNLVRYIITRLFLTIPMVFILLTIVFVVLAVPLFLREWGLIGGGLATLAGVLVIWANYLVRAYIFSHPRFSRSRPEAGSKDKTAL